MFMHINYISVTCSYRDKVINTYDLIGWNKILNVLIYVDVNNLQHNTMNNTKF